MIAKVIVDVASKSVDYKNELTMHFKNNEKVNIKKGKKVVLAAQILDELETRWQ
ncbi:TPA: hypothetical protein SD629_001177 [Staphylococcus aureus]|nr:hypothetical protein [Staphylococcus aureus]